MVERRLLRRPVIAVELARASLVVALLFVGAWRPLRAASLLDGVTDPQDGRLDISNWLIARRLGMWIGADFAVGPEGGAGCLQVGSAWR